MSKPCNIVVVSSRAGDVQLLMPRRISLMQLERKVSTEAVGYPVISNATTPRRLLLQ